jgi:acyl-coenzyme A thioesterase PaaI-like protein
MEVRELPFNKLIQLSSSDKSGYALMLQGHEMYTNHLGTVHAAAQFSLAEACSAQLLKDLFPTNADSFIPLVRQVAVKYRKPALGAVYAKANLQDMSVDDVMEQLEQRKRALFHVMVQLFDNADTLVMRADFEWFLTTKVQG